MGGDQLVTAVCGEETESASGDAIRDAETEEYAELIGEVKAVRRARDLLDARELVTAWTTSADIEHTKPAPDLVHAALDRSEAPDEQPVIMVGDTSWDIETAQAAGVSTLAVVTGGFSAQELREAGAWAAARARSDAARARNRRLTPRVAVSLLSLQTGEIRP